MILSTGSSTADFATVTSAESSFSSASTADDGATAGPATKAWAILSCVGNWLNEADYKNLIAEGLTMDTLQYLDHRDLDDIAIRLKLFPSKAFAAIMSISKF